MDLTPLMVTLLVALFAWRMYTRMKRLLSRQEFHRRKSLVSATVFCLLALLILATTAAIPSLFVGCVAGLAAGIALAYAGLRLTRFEVTSTGFFYTPNTHIGIGLSLALLLRIGYRMVQLKAGISNLAGQSPAALGHSPLTLVLLGMLLGYYATYSIGLLRWRRAAAVPAAPADSQPAGAGGSNPK
jgi:hypothetical protein